LPSSVLEVEAISLEPRIPPDFVPATHASPPLAPPDTDRLASIHDIRAIDIDEIQGGKIMKITHRLWRYLLMPLSLAGMLSISSAAELNPAAVVFKLPDQIPWSPVDVRGAQNAVVVGDPSKPGFYMVYTKWTKGNHFSRPHFHPNDRYIVVLQGTWWVGTGPHFDPANTTPLPPGSFVTHFGKQVHWDGAKDEDAVLLIQGEGPATSTYVKEE
jgi:hypothetical protein